MWTNLYFPRDSLVTIYAFFQKGIIFTSEVVFSVTLFETTYFFEIFLSIPSISFISIYFNMAYPNDILFISTNYFSWKSHM
jgi:hypothetical protein